MTDYDTIYDLQRKLERLNMPAGLARNINADAIEHLMAEFTPRQTEAIATAILTLVD